MSIFLQLHGEQERPQAHWLRTDEVLVDPSTDRLMRVWVEPGTVSPALHPGLTVSLGSETPHGI